MFRQFRLIAAAFAMLSGLAGVTAVADNASPQLAVWCDGKFGLCRYVDPKTQQEVIPARFERGLPFSEGLAAVRIDGRFGYIDPSGDVVIEPKFDLAGDFYQGMAEILIGEKTGVINRAGDIVVPPMFSRAIPLTKDVIIAVEGMWSSGHFEGFEKLPGLEEGTYGAGPAGLYHVGGYWIRHPSLSRTSFFAGDGGGLIWATERDRYGDLYGLLGSDGQWVIEPKYQFGTRLSDDRAVVRKQVGTTLLDGAIDGSGRLVIPLQPQRLSGWRNGWGMMQESGPGGRQSLIDKDGKQIGGRSFDKVELWEAGDVSAVLVDGHWKGIDRAGNLVPHPNNGKVYVSCPTFNVIYMDGKMQITDGAGRATVPHLLDIVQRPVCGVPFPVKLEGKWSFVGREGQLLFDPPLFEDILNFADGHAAVKQNGRWGVIDAAGRFVIEPTFESVLGRRAGMIQASIGKRQVWINMRGEPQPEPSIKPEAAEVMLDCGHGLKLFELYGKWGMADSNGNDVIPPRYRALVCFKNGIAWAPVDDRRRWCAIGPDGALREKPACRTEHYPPVLWSHHFPERLDADPFESSVLWTRAYLDFKNGQRAEPPRLIGDGVRGQGVILPP